MIFTPICHPKAHLSERNTNTSIHSFSRRMRTNIIPLLPNYWVNYSESLHNHGEKITDMNLILTLDEMKRIHIEVGNYYLVEFLDISGAHQIGRGYNVAERKSSHFEKIFA